MFSTTKAAARLSCSPRLKSRLGYLSVRLTLKYVALATDQPSRGSQPRAHTMSQNREHAILQDKEKAKHKGLALSGAAKLAADTSHVLQVYLMMVVVATEDTRDYRVAVGAGGGSRTHKGSRPGMCEVPAFTSFATPAPFQSDDRGNPAKATTRRLTRATVPRDDDNAKTDRCWYHFRAPRTRLLRPSRSPMHEPLTNLPSPIPYPLSPGGGVGQGGHG